METKIKKNQTAEIPTKSGSKYSYQYVDIAQIHDYLEENKMKYIQQTKRIDEDDYVMTKRYIDGKWEEEWLQGARVVQATLVGNNNPAQEQGSALTYARRYSLLMAFGLATEDDDANSLNNKNYNKNKITSKATPKQIEYINNLGLDIVAVCEYYNVEKIEDITIDQASEIIKKKGNK